MTGNDNIRISKVVREFNIGLGTLVEFLNKLKESILVGLTDNAPHVELNALKIRTVKLTVFISGKIVNDAACITGVIVACIRFLVLVTANNAEGQCNDEKQT